MKLGWPDSVNKCFQTYVKDFLNREWYSLGRYTELVEKEWVGEPENTITTANATAGIASICLSLKKTGRVDAVLIPEMTVPMVRWGVQFSDLKVYSEDVGDDFVLSLEVLDGIERSEYRDGYAVIYVATGGMIGRDFEDFIKSCRDRGIYLIGDLSHAHGCRYNGIELHKFFDAAVWSFYSTKILNAGDSGIIWFNNKEEAKIGRMIVNSGKARGSLEFGTDSFNFRTSEINAVAMYSLICRKEEIYHARNDIADCYKNYGIRSIHDRVPKLYTTYYKYPVMIKSEFNAERLEEIAKEKGIELTGRVHGKRDSVAGEFIGKKSKYISEHHVCLPLSYWTTEKEVIEVADFIKPYVE